MNAQNPALQSNTSCSAQDRDLLVKAFFSLIARVPSRGSTHTCVWVLGSPGDFMCHHLGTGLSASLGRGYISGSQLGWVILLPQTHLAMSRDVSGYHNGEEGCFWHLTGSRPRMLLDAHNAQDSPHKKQLSLPSVNSAEVGKPWTT